jgi:hypothetical protein
MRRPHVPLRAVALVLAAVMVAACGGSNGEEQTTSLDAAAFQQGYDDLDTMFDRATAGDADAADEAFAQVLPLTYLASEALANLPEEVAVRAQLIDVSARIQQELAGERRPDVLASLAEEARGALADAAEVLGIEPPEEQ